MINKIEKAYQTKLATANRRLQISKQEQEENNLKKRALFEKKYQLRIKRIERDKETAYKNEKIKEKNKALKKSNKPLKVIKKRVKLVNRVKRCDDIFSKYIRKRDNERCCTCNGIGNNCGHWISRKYRQYRRDEDNCMAQCRIPCNHKSMGNGEPIKFELALQKKGIDTEKMKENSLKINSKPSIEQLKEIYETYLKKYKEL